MAGCPWRHEEGQDRADGAARPFHVYDHEGAHLGSFASGTTAHDWAHLQVELTSLPAPLEVEDRRRGTGRRVWADHCEATRIGDTPARGAAVIEPVAKDVAGQDAAGGRRAEPAPAPGRAQSGAPSLRSAADPNHVTTVTIEQDVATEATPNHFAAPHPRRPG
jgi:hypothetical protein